MEVSHVKEDNMRAYGQNERLIVVDGERTTMVHKRTQEGEQPIWSSEKVQKTCRSIENY